MIGWSSEAHDTKLPLVVDLSEDGRMPSKSRRDPGKLKGGRQRPPAGASWIGGQGVEGCAGCVRVGDTVSQ